MAATFVVEDGSAKTDANAYADVAFVDQYAENHANPLTWTSLTDDQKKEKIREATRYIDAKFGVKWRGLRFSRDQALDWPRASVIDADDFHVSTNEIPPSVQNATAALALEAAADTDGALMPNVPSGSIASESDQVGSLRTSVTYSTPKKDETDFTLARRLLRKVIRSGVKVGRGE